MAVRLCAVLFMYNDILFLIMKHSLRSISLTLAFFAFGSAFAQGPNGSGTYYKAADGKKGKALKTALFNIIKSPNVVSYNSLQNHIRRRTAARTARYGICTRVQPTITLVSVRVIIQLRAICTIVSTRSLRVGLAVRCRQCIRILYTLYHVMDM